MAKDTVEMSNKVDLINMIASVCLALAIEGAMIKWFYFSMAFSTLVCAAVAGITFIVLASVTTPNE